MTERKRHDSVSIDIAAPPDRVYELVSDITRMGEWSPECYRCAWTKGATGPAVGARFKAKNKGGRGPSWFNTPTVTAADPGNEFAFNRSGPGIGSYTWRYVLEPTPTGTKLTESFDAERPLGKAMTLDHDEVDRERRPRRRSPRGHGHHARADQGRRRVGMTTAIRY